MEELQNDKTLKEASQEELTNQVIEDLGVPVFLSELRSKTLTELYNIGEKLGIENIYNYYK